MLQSTATDNRRVAKNTLFLYIRMIVILLVTLYTSRVILDVLGVSDYGVYNVVGGVVTMFAFLNNSMASATQRYLTFELGRGDPDRLRKVFSAAMHIHIAIGAAVVILAETAGLWLLNEKLVIDPDRMSAARWVYQFSVLSFFVNVIQVPYNATIVAHEKMDIFAYVSIVEAVAKLLLVYLLTVLPYDKLVLYGFLMLVLQVGIRTFYQIWCRKRYPECRTSAVHDRSLYREMSGFAGWNVFGSLAWVMKDQGMNILLNLFFGTAVNAARGVAMQVSNSVNGFVSNFQVAFNPQITKNYARGEVKEMERLTMRGLKFSFVLLYFIALPLLLNVDFVLGIWLKEVPDHSAPFIVLIMLDALLCTLFGSPLMTSLAATGRIRNYQVAVSLVIMASLPVAYIVLRTGAAPETVYYVTIAFSLLAGCARFLFARHQIGFSARRFITSVLLRIAAMLAVSLPVPLAVRYILLPQDGWLSFIASCIVSVACTAFAAWTVALDRGERESTGKMIRDWWRKIHGKKIKEDICRHGDCTGCSLCSVICPVSCISMREGRGGHLYPSVDMKSCTDCGLCHKSCPANHSGTDGILKKAAEAYAAWAKDRSEYMTSTSGGAAAVLSRHFISAGGVVYGCTVCPGGGAKGSREPFSVKHIRVDSIEGLAKLKGSRYVQSSIRDALPLVRKDARDGLPVLFIGTPCQVAAVRGLFRKVPESLTLVDIVCHGVPSVALLRKYIGGYLHIDPADVTDIVFRKAGGFTMEIYGHSGRKPGNGLLYTHKELSGLRTEELYYNLFMDGFTYRDSCYRCPYASDSRMSDMTIGDFWGLGKDVPDHPHGVSLILPVTEKGKRLVPVIENDMYLFRRSVQEAVAGNAQLRAPWKKSMRIRIFRMLSPAFGLKVYYLSVLDRIILKRIRKS